jgi:hypothetical protein
MNQGRTSDGDGPSDERPDGPFVRFIGTEASRANGDASDFDVFPNALVGVFDFLGFHELMDSAKDTDGLLKLGAQVKLVADIVRECGGERTMFTVDGKRSTTVPLVLQASDTFLVVKEGAEPQDILQFLWDIHQMLFYAVIYEMPLRGAVSKGPILFSRDRRLFLGRAAFEAVQLERAQEWSGACLSPSMVEHIEAVGLRDRLFPLVVSYDVPWKENKAPQMSANHAINWVADVMDFIHPDWLPTRFRKGSSAEDATVKRKIENTRAFLRHVLAVKEEHGPFSSPENRRVVLEPYNPSLGGRVIRFILDDTFPDERPPAGR